MCSSCSSASFFNDPIQYALDAQQQSQSIKIGVAVQATSLKAQKQVGEAMIGMLEDAARLGRELGKGLNFDATA